MAYEYHDFRNNGDSGSAYVADMGMSYSEYLTRTFRWMAFGLMITFGVAFLTAFSNLFYVANALYLPLTIAELALVWILSARVQTMQVGTARALFLAYAAINGMVLSYYFLLFDVSTLVMAFLGAAVYFGLLAVYGATTRRDLSAWGPRLMMALVALIVCGFAGMLFGFSIGSSLLYCGVGLVVFMLLTAYDTQKLQHYYAYYGSRGDLLEKSSIYGALSLYLDFINIFLYLVRIFGSSRSRRS